MTTRIDHTNCSHDRTAKGRAWCRNERNRALVNAQAAFLKASETNDIEAIIEYRATVDQFAYVSGISLDEAYNQVENGPVL